jgi:hypothetical protein
MIIQEYHNLTDEEIVFKLGESAAIQYALGIDLLTDENIYMTRQSFWSFKEKVRQKGLENKIFNCIAKGLVTLYSVDTSHIRLDSVNISSNMKNLSRSSLFFKTTANFLKNLKKNNREAFNSIDDSLTGRYFTEKSGYEVFGGSKPSERTALLQGLAEDVLVLVNMFQGDDRVSSMQSFRTLQRLLNDQCNIIEATEENPSEKVELKAPKEVSANSLQSPFDTDGGYDSHKPAGRYQAQIGETFQPDSEDGNSDSEKKPSLILHVGTESAAHHDSHAVKPAINDLKDKGAEPKVLLADTAYGSDDNVEFAKEEGVDLVSPVPGSKGGTKESSAIETANCEADLSGKEEAEKSEVVDETRENLSLADFEKDENGRITKCPMGQVASTSENKAGTGNCSTFDVQKCQGCPNKGKCPVKVGKRKASITYTQKDTRIAERRRAQESSDFKKLYRKRSGVEATNSLLARKFGIKRLRVRGAKAVSCAVIFKALAANIWRIASFKSKKRK